MNRIRDLLEKLKWSHVFIIVSVAAALFYFTLDTSEIEMRNQSVLVSEQELASLEKKIQEAKEFERQFEDKKRRYADLVKELQNIQGTLPKQFFLPELLSELLREAKQLEIEITSIQPDASEKKEELYNSLGFDIEARGTYLQFFIFLDRLAGLKRLVSVENFNISLDSERTKLALGGDEGVFAGTKLSGGRVVYPGVKGSLRVITYRYRGSNAPAPAEPQPPQVKKGGQK